MEDRFGRRTMAAVWQRGHEGRRPQGACPGAVTRMREPGKASGALHGHAVRGVAVCYEPAVTVTCSNWERPQAASVVVGALRIRRLWLSMVCVGLNVTGWLAGACLERWPPSGDCLWDSRRPGAALYCVDSSIMMFMLF